MALEGLCIAAGEEIQHGELDRGQAVHAQLLDSRLGLLEHVVQQGDRARVVRDGGGDPLDMLGER